MNNDDDEVEEEEENKEENKEEETKSEKQSVEEVEATRMGNPTVAHAKRRRRAFVSKQLRNRAKQTQRCRGKSGDK